MPDQPYSSPVTALCELLKELGVTPKIGLEAQGHIPTVERMRADGKSWDEIARVIRWSSGSVVEEWYGFYLDRQAKDAPHNKRENTHD